jgi:hypothetical protein
MKNNYLKIGRKMESGKENIVTLENFYGQK